MRAGVCKLGIRSVIEEMRTHLKTLWADGLSLSTHNVRAYDENDANM